MTPTEEILEQDIKFVLDSTILNAESLGIIATSIKPPLSSQEIIVLKTYLYVSVIGQLVRYPENYKYIRAYADLFRNQTSKSDKTIKGEALFRTALEYEVNRIFVPFHLNS